MAYLKPKPNISTVLEQIYLNFIVTYSKQMSQKFHQKVSARSNVLSLIQQKQEGA